MALRRRRALYWVQIIGSIASVIGLYLSMRLWPFN